MNFTAEGDAPFTAEHSGLPLPTASNQVQTKPLQGLRVLAVDDDLFSVELIAAILEPHGVEVKTCTDAADAMRCAEEALPDVIVADIAMPHEDGLSLIKRLRALATRSGGNIPAVAVSGYARERDRQAALDAGFQDYLVKPIEPDHLVLSVTTLADNKFRHQQGH